MQADALNFKGQVEVMPVKFISSSLNNTNAENNGVYVCNAIISMTSIQKREKRETEWQKAPGTVCMYIPETKQRLNIEADTVKKGKKADNNKTN